MNEEESIVGDVITGTTGFAGDVVGGVTGVAGDVVGGVTGGIGSGISTVSGGIGDAIGGPIGGVVGGVGGAVGTVVGGVGGLAGDVIGGVGGAIGGGVDAIADGITGGVPSVADVPPLPGSGGEKDPCNRLDYIKDRLGGAPLIGNLSLKDIGVGLDGLAAPKLPKKLPSPKDVIGDIGDGIKGGISDLADDIKGGIGGVMEDLSPSNLMASAKKKIGSAGREALAGAIESKMSDMLGPVKGGLGNQLKRSFKTNMLMLGVDEVANIISGEPNILDPCAGRGKEKIKGLTADSIGAAKGGKALAGIKGKLDSAVDVKNLSNKELASAQTAVLGNPELPGALDKFKLQDEKQSALFEEKTEEVIAEVSKETAEAAVAEEEAPTPEEKKIIDANKFAPPEPPPVEPLFVDSCILKPTKAWEAWESGKPTPTFGELLDSIEPALKKFKDSIGEGEKPTINITRFLATKIGKRFSAPDDQCFVHTHDSSFNLDVSSITNEMEIHKNSGGKGEEIAYSKGDCLNILQYYMGKGGPADMRGGSGTTSGNWMDGSMAKSLTTPNRYIAMHMTSNIIEFRRDHVGQVIARARILLNFYHTVNIGDGTPWMGPIEQESALIRAMGYADKGVTDKDEMRMSAYKAAVGHGINHFLDGVRQSILVDGPNWNSWFNDRFRI